MIVGNDIHKQVAAIAHCRRPFLVGGGLYPESVSSLPPMVAVERGRAATLAEEREVG